jgi:hypothetical protein
MSDRSPIVVPPREDLEQVAAALGVAQNRVGRFASSVVELANVLAYSRKEGITYREARQRVGRALKKVRKSLQTALEAANSEQSLLTHTTSGALARDLGSALSLSGIRRLIDEHVSISIDERDLELAALQSRDGGAEWVISEIQRRIPAVVGEQSAKTLCELLKLILQAVDTEISANGRKLSGRPRNTEREYVLDALEKLHDETFDSRATTASGGTFNSMCEAIFASLDLNDTGLQTAIERFLRR